MLRDFFAQNLDIVFLLYGFSFIVMAIAILIQPRRDSSFKLSGILLHLALFGLIHGINEWLDMLAIISVKGADHYHNDALIKIVRLIFLSVSYLFLFEFGRRLAAFRLKKILGSKWLTFISCSFILVFMVFSKEERSIWPRYFLGFPGGLLAAFGFIWYYYDNKIALKDIGVRGYFIAATFSVEVYAILGGFVVPGGNFFPASLINNQAFLNAVGIPVQVFRSVCAGILSWAIWNILGIFNWEVKTKLEDSLIENVAIKDNLDNIIKSMVDSLIIVGPDRKIHLANTATSSLLGYRKEGLIDLPISEVLAEEASVFQDQRFNQLLGDGSIVNLEANYKARSGKSIPVLLSVSVMRDKSLNFQGLVLIAKDITERKFAEELIRDSEEKYRTMVEYSNDLIWTLDKKGNFTYFNRKAEEVSGYKIADWLGKSFRPMLPQEEISRIEKIFLSTLSGSAQHYEVSLFRLDGSVFALSVNSAPLFKAGEIIGTVSFGQDVTEHKKAQRKIEGEYNFRQAVENSMLAGLIVIDLNGRQVYTNPAFCKMVGWTQKEMAGQVFPFNFCPSEELDKISSALQLTLGESEEGRKSNSYEVKFKRRNGEYFEAMILVSSLLDSEQKKNGWLLLVHDISERKKAEQALKQAKEQAELLYKVVPSAIFTVDKDRRITGWNDKAAQITGYTAEEMLGKDCLVFSDYPCKQRCGLYSEEIVKPVVAKECTLITKKGEKRFILKNVDILKDANGNQIGGVESFEDITDRKWAEEELKNAYNQLKLTQYQLIQAEKMDTVGRLASGVAHEVKNPLAIILQGVDFISKKMPADNENVSLTLKYINDAVQRANSIIKGLLDFSSMSEVSTNPEDLNDLIQATLLLLKNNIDQSHVEIIRDFTEAIPLINVDKNRIEQVFVNLILNGIQAMPGGGELTIRTYVKELAAGEKWAVTEIEDTGPGIPEEIIGKVFDPFFTTKRGKGGTGLGLSVVMSIIEMHGGKIELENRQDTHGVRVTVMLKA